MIILSLLDILSTDEAYAILDRGEGKYWDGQGVQSEESLLEYWRHEEMLHPESVRIAAYDESLLGEIVSDAGAEMELAALLAPAFGAEAQRAFAEASVNNCESTSKRRPAIVS